jgi:peptidoglycan/LPS O-acetylase OafA/YrhL
MQGPEVLIPITLFAGGFAMIFGVVYLRTRENMAMIEKGMNPKRYANLPAPFRSLKLGLLLLGAGAGLLLAYIIDHNTLTPHEPEPIYFALIAIGGGLGLIGSYAMEKKEWERVREYEQKLKAPESQI